MAAVATRRIESRPTFASRLPNDARNHFIAMLGEFVGTFLFLFFAFVATHVANAAVSEADTEQGGFTQAPNTSTLLYISLAFAFSLVVNVWVFFRISGGLFNPVVALAAVLVGAMGPVRAVIVVIAQVLGAICAAAVASGLVPGPLNVATTLGGDTSTVRGLFFEMFLTAQLIFTILMLAVEKHKATFLAPIGIGLSLFIAELAGVYYTSGSLNPARSFAPCVILGLFPGYHWIYWVGPALGSLVAVGLYHLIKILEYETANPGQDSDGADPVIYVEYDDAVNSSAPAARSTIVAARAGLANDGASSRTSMSQQHDRPTVAAEQPFHNTSAVERGEGRSATQDPWTAEARH